MDRVKNNNGQSDQYINHDLEVKWHTIQKDYRKRYPNLTSEDVDYKTGEFDAMTERIAIRTNRKPHDINDEIKNWPR